MKIVLGSVIVGLLAIIIMMNNELSAGYEKALQSYLDRPKQENVLTVQQANSGNSYIFDASLHRLPEGENLLCVVSSGYLMCPVNVTEFR